MSTILTALRLSKNWSIKDVARELEITPEEYARMEEGERRTTIDNALRLGNLYSIPPETFFAAQAKFVNNIIGPNSKGVVNAVNYYESNEDK